MASHPLAFSPVVGYAVGSVVFAHTRPLRFHYLVDLDGVLYPMLGLLVGLSVGVLLDVIAARCLTGSWRFTLRDVFLWTSLAAVWCWVGYVYLSLIREFYPTR